jgi:hypothetical protein
VPRRKKAQGLIQTFREHIKQRKAEITALQILYSRPYKQRLTERMLKELEEKHRTTDAAWTEDDDFDFAPFAQRGGLGKAYQLFGDQL